VRAARPVRVVRPFPLLDVVLGAGVLVIAALLVNSLARNQQLSWGTVGTYLFSPAILRGVWTTVWGPGRYRSSRCHRSWRRADRRS
jgi:hypothetical protein